MTHGASFNPDGFVLEDERSALVRVTLVADKVLVRNRPELAVSDGPLVSGRAVRIVAIGALDQPFIDPMTEWLLEIRPLFNVARVAQARLLADQQEFRLRVMNRMAARATDAVLIVPRAQEVALFETRFMAGQTLLADFVGLRRLEAEDLAFVPAAFDVRRAGAMARFATTRTVRHRGLLCGEPVW